MRKDKLATTNAGNQESRAPPPPPITTHEDHIPRPPLERRLQGGPRHQDASAIRPKAKTFVPKKGGRGGGGGPGSLTHSQEGERHRSAGGIEVDVKSTKCFPHSKTSTTPSSTARSDRPSQGEGAGRKKKPPAAATRPRRPHTAQASGREGHLHPRPLPWLPEPLTPARGSRSLPHRKTRSSRQTPWVAARRGEKEGEVVDARVWVTPMSSGKGNA